MAMTFKKIVTRKTCFGCGYWEPNSRMITPADRCPKCMTDLNWWAGVITVRVRSFLKAKFRKEIDFQPLESPKKYGVKRVWVE